MNDPNTILILSPADEYGLAADAFRLPHNRDRYAPPSAVIDDGPSRETTPVDSWTGGTRPSSLSYLHRIFLTFDQKVKVPGGQYNISFRHFCITFDHQRRPILKDASTNGVIVSYDEQAKTERRNHFNWVLLDDFGKIHVEVQMDGLAFNVHLPKHRDKARKMEYEQNVDRFMANAPIGISAMGNMGLHGPSVPSREVLASNQKPIYLERNELGRGAFGKVCKVVNASTGDEYAGKEFFHRTGWKREIEIMKRLHHENIVQFIDFRPETKPLLVIEYLRLGSLEEQNMESPVAVEEMMVLMSQSLSALAYVHQNNITHRDLKPGNLLVYSRPPFSVKLCDFGLAQDKSVLQTFCGSAQYSAPKIFDNSSYTNAVDVWSLAVIMLEYIYGLPRMRKIPELKKQFQEWGLGWCQRLVTAAEDWDSDSLIDFLTENMLKLDPYDRLPAVDCLRRASEHGLFDGVFSKTGHVTPRLQPVTDADETQQAGRSIIMSHLWGGGYGGVLRQEEITTFSQSSRIICAAELESTQASVVSLANENSTSSAGQGPHMRTAKRRRTVHCDYSQLLDGPVADSLGNVMPPRPSTSVSLGKGNQHQLYEFVRGTRSDDGKANHLSSTSDLPARLQYSQTNNETSSKRHESTDIPPIQPPLERLDDFVVLEVQRTRVFLRISTAWVNLTQLVTLTWPDGHNAADVVGERLNRRTRVEVSNQYIPRSTTWIDFDGALEVCGDHDLGECLKPLLDFGKARQAQISSLGCGQEHLDCPFQPSDVSIFTTNGVKIPVCRNKWLVNITRIIRAAGRTPKTVTRLKRQHLDVIFEYANSGGHVGTYCGLEFGIRLCRDYRLGELEDFLLLMQRESRKADQMQPLPSLPSNSIDYYEGLEFWSFNTVRPATSSLVA